MYINIFYQVKQYREKKHKKQGFIQMYNGAFLHNMGKKHKVDLFP